MYETNKIASNIKPETFKSLNNGIWYYNYDIEEKLVTILTPQKEQKEELRYYYVQVRISGQPTLSKCYEAILKTYKDKNGVSLYDILLSKGSNDQIEDINYNIKVDFGLAPEKSPLDMAKELILRKIDSYDSSSNVNSFVLNGIQVWLSKDTRVGLMNSITIEKNSGKEESTLWLNEICITVNCDTAIQILSALELYALNCYNVTANHKAIVKSLETVKDVNNYNYKTGYPDKLEFNV